MTLEQIFSVCACGMVETPKGYMHEKELDKHFENYRLSHGVHSKECMKKYYDYITDKDYLKEKCEGLR